MSGHGGCRDVSPVPLEDRREKEKAMHERFSARVDKALASLARRIEHAKRPLDRSQIERQIGRLFEQTPVRQHVIQSPKTKIKKCGET